MHEADFWTQCAEAMALQIEGRRLIAAELVDLARQAWRDVTKRCHAILRTGEQRRHLPPV